jgi:hypothetical protein
MSDINIHARSNNLTQHELEIDAILNEYSPFALA